MKRLRIFFLLLLALLPAACSQEADETPAAPGETTAVPEPTVIPAGQAPAGQVILADGQLVATDPAVVLSFETAGRLLSLEVRPGDRVSTGDIVATLDDAALQEAVTAAALQVSQSENGLAQAQLALDDLLEWEPDETAVQLAEANLAAAQAQLVEVQSQAEVSASNLTAVNVQIAQAQRAVEDAQEAYDQAHDPARDWELEIPWRAEFLRAEREGTARALQSAQEALSVAYAQYNLTAAGVDNEATVANAEAAVISARQALEQATSGPRESDIAAARLQVVQAELSLEQSLFNQRQAEDALAQAVLTAPAGGTILTVDAVAGTRVGAGTPILSLQDTSRLAFHTTNLSERDLAAIQPGQPAQITLKSYPNAPLDGTVARIAPQAGGTVGDAAVFTVIITLDDPGVDLRPGMTGRVEIRS